MRSRSRALLLTLVVGVLLAIGSLPALAAETASSEFLIIQPDDRVEDDLYAAAVKVDIQGTIDGDLVAFASEEVVIDGMVTGSVTAVAPRVVVNGRVEGALRVSGGSLRISGEVGRDAVAVVWELELDKSSSVGRDVQAWAIDMSALGQIGRDLKGSIGSLSLAGVVEGDVNVSVGNFTVVDELRVSGDLGYRSPSEGEGLEKASVGGAVVRKTPLPPNIRVRALGLFGRFMVIVFLTLTAVGVAYGWPDRTQKAVQRVATSRLKTWGLGAAVMASPLLLGGLAALMVALAPTSASLPLLGVMAPVILAALGIVFAMSLVAGVPAAGWVGATLFKKLDVYGSMLAGSLLIGGVWLIPWIGWLVPVLALPLGLGAWLLSWRGAVPDQT
jgi:cytoskeletal protein CcmA (bactofilin family)